MSQGQLITLSLVVMSMVCLALLILVRNKERSMIRTLLVAIVLSELFLYLATIVELAVPDLGTKLLLNNIEFTFFASISVLFFLYAVEYTKWRGGFSWRIALIAFCVPAALLVLLYTNDLHHLFFHYVLLRNADGYQELYQEFATGFFVAYIYCRLLTMVGTLFLFRLYATAPSTRKRQVGIVLAASSIPWLITTGDFLFYYSETYASIIIDFGFLTLNAVLFYAGTFMFRTADVTPLALDSLVERMPEGVLIIEGDGTLAYTNESAMAALGRDRAIVGQKAEEVLPRPLGAFLRDRGSGGPPSALSMGIGDRCYDVDATELRNNSQVKGHLIIMRDVTEERANKEALRLANEKLGLLTSVVRHDLTNKLTAAQGYIELSKRDNGHSPAMVDRMNKLGELMYDMGGILEFTKEYQRLGVDSPSWQDVGGVVHRAVQGTPLGPVKAVVNLDRIEVYADMMLITAVANLLDNSVRHGGRVTTVRIASAVSPDRSLVITYEDDGVGIPVRDKEMIFELGYGRNTGLGLFLTRQVLQITGCSIAETGEEGRGCRFVITVPPSRWRAPDT